MEDILQIIGAITVVVICGYFFIKARESSHASLCVELCHGDEKKAAALHEEYHRRGMI